MNDKLVLSDNNYQVEWTEGPNYTEIQSFVNRCPALNKLRGTILSLLLTGTVQVLNDGSLLVTSIKENLPSVVCTVENVHGKDSISYSVRVVKPPVAPTIRVSKITATSITLSWNIPHNGGALLQGN